MIFKRLTVGWVNDNVGFFFLLYQLAECDNKPRFGASMEIVGGRRTGKWTKVITRLKEGVVAVGLNNGRSW